jgi:hypothetical protein
MDKRAQGLPITTVILAILGIVVLVILFAILTGRLTIFSGVVNECPGACLTGDLKGVPPQLGLLESTDARSSCDSTFEKQIYGSFISQVRTSENKPIACTTCCQRLA